MDFSDSSFLPYYKNVGACPSDGSMQALSSFCKKKFDDSCKKHYEICPEGFSECPYGFATYKFPVIDGMHVWTGIRVRGVTTNLKEMRKRESLRGSRIYEEGEVRSLADANKNLWKKMLKKVERNTDQFREHLDRDVKHTKNSFHEIQPLNAEIKASLNRMKASLGNFKGPLSERLAPDLDAINEATELISTRMLQRDILIDNVFIPGNPKVIKLKRDCESIFKIFKSRLKKNQIELNIVVGDDVCISTHREFKLILWVLIENALKYSPVRVEQPLQIRINKSESNSRLTINSLGPKIERSERNEIYKPFYRSVNVRAILGNGEGLYTAKIIAEKLGMELKHDQHGESSFSLDGTSYFDTTFMVIIPNAMLSP